MASVRLRRLTTGELSADEVSEIRSVLDAAFGDDEEERFTDHDWDHAVGGLHVVVDVDGEIVAHGSVVERALEIDHHPMRTGYVEAVATTPLRQGRGHGTSVMRAIGDEIRPGSSSARSGRAATASTSVSAGRPGRAVERTHAQGGAPDARR